MAQSVQEIQSYDNAAGQLSMRARRETKIAVRSECYTGNLIAFRLPDGSLPKITNNLWAASQAPAQAKIRPLVAPFSDGESTPSANASSTGLAASEAPSDQTVPESVSYDGSWLGSARTVLTRRSTVAVAVLVALTGGAVAGSTLTSGLIGDSSQSAGNTATIVVSNSAETPVNESQNALLPVSASVALNDSEALENAESDLPFQSVTGSQFDEASNKQDFGAIDEALSASEERAAGYLKELETLRAKNNLLLDQASALKEETASLSNELLDLGLQVSGMVAASQPQTVVKTIYNFVNLPTGSGGGQPGYTAAPASDTYNDQDYIDYSSYENEEQYYADQEELYYDEREMLEEMYEQEYIFNDEGNELYSPYDERGLDVPIEERYGVMSEEEYELMMEEQAYERQYGGN